jgi:hypothetical protein
VLRVKRAITIGVYQSYGRPVANSLAAGCVDGSKDKEQPTNFQKPIQNQEQDRQNKRELSHGLCGRFVICFHSFYKHFLVSYF